jgi:hypothetical protein
MAHGFTLISSPAAALSALLTSVQRAGVSRADAIAGLVGASGADVASIVERRRILTSADSEEVAALATAAGMDPGALAYRALMAGEVEPDPEDMDPMEPVRVRFTLSTADVDRARDIVGQRWRLDAFRGNPVAPWGHRSQDPPVGIWEGVGVVDGRLRGTLVAHPIASYPLSVTVAEQLRRRIIRTVSVGFMPGIATPRAAFDEGDPRHSMRGVYFDDNELLECSPVTVPMNARAVADLDPPVNAERAADAPDDDSDDGETGPDWATFRASPCLLW